MKKKYIAFIGLLLCLSFAACTSDDADKDAGEGGAVQEMEPNTVQQEREEGKNAGAESLLDLQNELEEGATE